MKTSFQWEESLPKNMLKKLPEVDGHYYEIADLRVGDCVILNSNGNSVFKFRGSHHMVVTRRVIVLIELKEAIQFIEIAPSEWLKEQKRELIPVTPEEPSKN